VVAAALIGLTVLALTPLFYFLPMAVLAAVIMVAACGLIDVQTLKHTWRYNKADAAELIVTFLTVLVLNSI